MWFLFSRFKGKRWKKYMPEKRLKCLIALEKKVAKKLGVEPLKLEIHEDPNWNCFGAFTVQGDSKKILLHQNMVYEPTLRFHAMETIAHETRHAYQFLVVSRDLKWYEFTAKRWKRNWGGYFSSSTDDVMYNNQAIERDAQKYSIKFLRKYRGKYKKEQDYLNTYEAVLYRYNQADLDARKKYGFFYKLKIEKKVKDNSIY